MIDVGSRTKLFPNEIVLLEADINYTLLHLVDGKKITVSYHLGKLQERLSRHSSFIRPNRNTIVNLNYVSDCNLDKLTINSQIIQISRRRKESFRLLYDEFISFKQ